jgi:peptidoglycan/LPS O-acetylase OafA/YrhL
MTYTRISSLDVLRGYASLAVVLIHIDLVFLPVKAGALKSTIDSLNYAVPLFFALSAFSLLYGYAPKLFEERSMVRFYVRRVFRIVPLFYAMLLLYVVLRYADGLPPSWGEILANVTFTFPLIPGYFIAPSGLVGHWASSGFSTAPFHYLP